MQRYIYFTKLKIRVPSLVLVNESDNKDIWWLRMEQISQVPVNEWKIAESEEMCGGKVGSIVNRDSLGIQLASSVTPKEWILHPEAMIETLLTLSVRYILDPMCGDSGLWNLLVRTSDWTVWCIDYEEERADVCKKINHEWTAPLSTRSWTQERMNVFESMRGHTELKKKWKEIIEILEVSDIPSKSSRVAEIHVALKL